jgi:PAS domain S-box-containing protein
VRLSHSGQGGLLDGEPLDALARAIDGRRVLISELYAGGPDGRPRLDVVAPLSAAAEGTQTVGALILRVDARAFLYALIWSWPLPSRSAETLLVRRDGDDVLYLNDLRHQERTALTLRIPIGRTDLPAVAAVTGWEDVFYGRDYRGVRVIAVMRAIPGSSWFMVAKEDTAEVLGPWVVRAILILAVVVGLASAAAALAAALWQRNEMAHYRAQLVAEDARRASEELYRTTLLSVGDAVISTDASGKVQLLNPVAEALTGWPQAEARGRPLVEVFRVLHAQTRERLEDPVSRVLREGVVVGVADQTVLVDRQGRERSIADSGAPIRNGVGTVVGVVLVFRDVSVVLRSAEEREARLQMLRMLNEPGSTRELIERTTGLLQKWTGCEAVGVRLQADDDYPYYETRGFPPEFIQAETYLCERGQDGQIERDSDGRPVLACMCGNVLRGRVDPGTSFFTAKGSFYSNGTSELLASTTEADRMARTRNRCNSQGYESVALIPLRVAEKTLGLVQFNDTRKDRFTSEILAHLEDAADQIAIGVSQRQAQAALKVSEEHYRSLFENMLNGFAFCRMLFEGGRPHDFIYLEVNDAFVKLTGLQSVVGRKVSEVIPGIQVSDPGLLETYGRVATTGVPERFEILVRALDMWFAVSVYSPRRGYFVAVFDVITERKRAEAARLMLASAVEQAAEMIVVTDAGGCIQYVNPAFEAVTGYTKEEVLGRNPSILKSGSHEPGFYEELWETLERGKAWVGHFVNRKKDGTLYTEDATISPVNDATGKVVSYVAVKRDSTRERRLEDQLRQAQKMESVGRLAGGVAHDFNNMLQVIAGYVDLSLALVDSRQPLHANLLQIRTAALRSAELTGRLLAFARKQTVSPKVLDANDAVAGMLKMLQRLIGEDIELSWVPGRDVGRILIDPTQLDQILANLAVNARDAIAGVGKLAIGTETVVFDEEYCALHAGFVPGTFVLLTVSDNGCGMDAQTLAHLFEPFFTTKAVGEGTGLGLATVYGIVRQNNGFISVYSEPGRGTTFKIYLPRQHETDALQAEPEPAVASVGTETVLVVEDEAAILDLSRVMLENLGYTVLTARTPAEAIRLVSASERAIHLLITDVVMPQMNGRDLSDLVAQLRPGLRTLFMSGYTADVIAHQGMLEEGVCFVSKPFTVGALAEKVREALALGHAGDGG